MGRKCAVPHCYTGYRKCTDKASLYKVPDDDFFLNKWQEAIAREDRPITPRDYVCEKHFKDEDILRKRIRKDVLEVYQRPRLKPDAIPSIFPDLPEFILKMTKKRRKLNITVPSNFISFGNSNEKGLLDKSDVKKELNEDEDKNSETDINNDEIYIKSENEDIPSSPIEEKEEYDSTGAKLYYCDECSYKTKFSHNLRTHKVKHLSGETAYMTCELCLNYKTKWEITYVNHMKSKHGIILKEYFKCPFCIFKTKNRLFFNLHYEKEHGKQENVLQEYKCQFKGCNFNSESKTLLDIHNLSHGKIIQSINKNLRTFSCKKCTFKSNCKGTLVTHVKSVHKEDKNQKTQSINKKLPSELNNYSYSCKECYFKTNSKGALVKHGKSAHIAGIPEENNINFSKKVTKSKELPHSIKDLKNKSIFKCSRCPFKSKSENLLKKHLIKHQMLPSSHQRNVFKCSQCSYTTFLESELVYHKQNTFHCNECFYATNDKSEHLKHILTHRNTSVEVVVRNSSLEESCSSLRGSENVKDFSVVTIKEEPNLFTGGDS